MKNTLLSIFLLSAFVLAPSIQANAQAALFILLFGDKVASEEFHLSLDAGLNVTSFNGYDDGKTFFGPNFGLGTHIKINDRWHIAPEIKFLSKRGVDDVENPIKLAEDFEGSETTSRIALNYIDIPVLFQYKFENGLYFSAGPQISFLTEAEQQTKITLADGTTTAEVVQNLKDEFNGIDYSFPVEIAYAFKSIRGGKGMDLRLRYNYGLNEMFKDNDLGLSANHSMFQVFLTFPFVEHNTDEGGE